MPSPPVPFEVIGHRGACGYAPENTLASFEKAIALGLRWVEFDVQLSSDGVPMVIHDATLDRTTCLRGAVSNTPSQVMVGPCIEGGHAVPTLTQVLALLDEKHVGAYVEIKSTNSQAAALVLATLGPSRPDRIVSSFDMATLRKVREIDPTRPIQALFTTFPPHLDRIIQRLAPNQIGVRYGYLSPSRAKQIRAFGLPVMTYTVNTPEGLSRARVLGMSGAFCDFPDRAPAA